MKLNWTSLQLNLNCLYSIYMCIAYLKNEEKYLLWLTPAWSLFKLAFYNLNSCHFPATWHSRLCVKYGVLSFSTRCKAIPHKLNPSHINFAIWAGWSSLLRVQGTHGISLAGDSFMSLLRQVQCPSWYHWSQSLKKAGQYVPNPHLLFLSVVSVLLLLTMLDTPKHSDLAVDQSDEV